VNATMSGILERLVLPHLAFWFNATLVTAVLALLLIAVSTIRRLGPARTQFNAIIKIIGGLGSISGILLAVTDHLFSLRPTPADEGKHTIDTFYRSIQNKDFDSAYRLIHRAKIDDIHRRSSSWGRDEFAHTYDTAQSFQNINISDAIGGAGESSRRYLVTFDVCDEVPRNRLFDARQREIGELVASGIINADALVTSVLADLRSYYDIPGDVRPDLEDVLLHRQTDSIFDPMLVFEVHRLLSERHLSKYPEAITPASRVRVWRHVLQGIRVDLDGTNWEIRDGLYPPLAVAVYVGSGPEGK